MKYQPTALSAADQELAKEPEVGAELNVSWSASPFGIITNVEQSGTAAGALVAQPSAYDVPAAGMDMQVVCLNAVVSTAPIVLTLNVVDEDDSSTTAVATLAKPDWLGDSSADLPQGTAFDLTPATGASKKIKSVTSVASITYGATGNKFAIVGLPTSWNGVGCVQSVDPSLAIPGSKALRCGFNPSRFVKAVPGEVSSLTITALYTVVLQGLAALNGLKVCIRVDKKRADRVTVETMVIGGYRPVAKSPGGDGDAETVTTAEGPFENAAIFVAPSA